MAAACAAILILCLMSTKVSCMWFNSLNALKSKIPAEVQVQAVQGLLSRLFPETQSRQFELSVDPTLNSENETVIVDKGEEENKIKITGTSGVAVAFGIQSYLKRCCHIHVSWDGNQLSLPPVLPVPQNRSVTTSVGWFNYYANVCTFSYSFVWWNWTQWEQHIDWMALNGINLPLVTIGQESILRNVFIKMGVSEKEVDDFFTGPTFLAWNQMGNLKRWGGPLSKSWHAKRLLLGQTIVKRMVEFGMTPVLPAFTGHVPDAMKKIYPNASISESQDWHDFGKNNSCMMFLDPSDPLFQEIGLHFMIEMNKTYGLYHAYSADPFNEIDPKSFDTDYITATTKAIYSAMSTVDPKAVWVIQAWMFLATSSWYEPKVVHALSTSVPRGNLLFLDLYAEHLSVYDAASSYHGQPFIWCMLHNFGGRQGFHGSVYMVNEGLSKAVRYASSTLVGTGLSMEGIHQNYPIYEMALDLFWSPDARPVDQIAWVKNMASRRYGKATKSIETAWELLWTSVYNCTEDCVKNKNNPAITSSPIFGIINTVSYERRKICKAWKMFVLECSQYTDSDLYRRDIVDLTREILQLIAEDLYLNMSEAFHRKDINQVRYYGTKLLQLIADLDQLLNSNENFLLGSWVNSAMNMANSKEERSLFEFNSKIQLTTWGPLRGEITDYARKQWGGLMNDYYKQRWELFFDTILQNLANGTKFNQHRFNIEVWEKIEQPFCNSHVRYPDRAVGDSVVLSEEIFSNYHLLCEGNTNV